MHSTLSQLFPQRIEWVKQKLLLRGQRWIGKPFLAVQWLIVAHSQKESLKIPQLSLGKGFLMELGQGRGANWWCGHSLSPMGCSVEGTAFASKANWEWPSSPLGWLTGSAFYNVNNCRDSLPPFEANEELAKACLPLEKTGLGSRHVLHWCKSQGSHRTHWYPVFQVHEE